MIPGERILFQASILAYPFPNRSTHPAARIGIHSSNQNLEIPGRKSEETVRINVRAGPNPDFFFMITHDYTLFEENANEHHVTQIDETNYKKGFNSPRGEETI